MITTVTGKNQVTIPAKLAKQLEIEAGTRLDWSTYEDDTIIVRILPRRGALARQLTGMGQAWLSDGDDPVKELIQERVQDDAGQST